MKRLLTIQDLSCVGQCSTAVALPLVSACGIECAVLPPILLSAHTGFPSWTAFDVSDRIAPIADNWRGQGIAFDAFYTGYLCARHIDPVLDVVSRCARPGALRFVDPAMADDGRLYSGFDADFPRQMARLVRGADFVLPNLTEAALLVGEAPKTEGLTPADVERLIERLHALDVRNVVLTGVSFSPDALGSATSDGSSVVYDFNPRVGGMRHGTGDVFASAFVGAVLRGRSAARAAALAADVVCEAIRRTEPGHWYGVSFELAIPYLIRQLEEDER